MNNKNNNIGKNVEIVNPVNIYGCTIGNDSFIGPFVEIQRNCKIGSRVRVSSHSFICSGVVIHDDSFIGHGVMFVNDKFDSDIIEDWKLMKTIIQSRVRIGSNSTILPVKIGRNSIVGAGSVVTKDVPMNTIVAGNPAKIIKKI